MRSHHLLLLSTSALLIVFTFLSAIVGCKSDNISSQPIKAARILLSSITIPSTSEVTCSGPVPSGTIIREDVPEPDTPAELKIPDKPGTYYAFFIDDHPLDKFEHQVRFAYVNVDTHEVDFVYALWRLTIFRPDREPTPFELIDERVIDGVKFLFVQGDGGGVVVEVSQDLQASMLLNENEYLNAIEPLSLDYHLESEPEIFETIQPFVAEVKTNSMPVLASAAVSDPEICNACTTKETGKQSNAVGYRNPGGDSLTVVSPLIGERSNTPQSNASRACEKQAMVIDGGDTFEGWWHEDWAENMAEQAEAFAEWLEEKPNNFTVWRASCYYKNIGKYVVPTKRRKGYPFDSTTVLTERLNYYVEYFTKLGPPAGGCDELFIYINSHGSPWGCVLYSAEDRGASKGTFPYDLMFDRIERLPRWVKVTMFWDHCRAGAAVKVLQGYEATWIEEEDRYNCIPRDDKEDYISVFCESHCALTIIAVCSENYGAPCGLGENNSASEDFLRCSGQDSDGDGNKDDIHDRFKFMSKAQDLEASVFHKPDGTSWCSLDGVDPRTPTPQPPTTPSSLMITIKEQITQIEYQIGEGCPNGKSIGVVSISSTRTGRIANKLSWELVGNVPDWLDVQPTKGFAIPTSNVWFKLVNCERITQPGVLTATFKIKGWDPSAVAANSENVTIKVSVIVFGKEIPTIDAYPTDFGEETILQGEGCPEGKYVGPLRIKNVGGGTLAWRIISDVKWLRVNKWSGVSDSELDVSDLDVSIVDCELIPVGIHRGHLLIEGYDSVTSEKATNSPLKVAVTVNCIPGSPSQPEEKPLPPADQTIRVSYEVEGICEKTDSNCSCNVKLYINAEDLTGGDYPLNRIILKVNGEVWYEAEKINTDDFPYPIQKSLACYQTFNVELTAYNSAGQSLTQTGTFVTTP